tara:strand:- start:3774 stop:4058 length:285 start_codon:yes stop_codon:yes gene_type:complete
MPVFDYSISMRLIRYTDGCFRSIPFGGVSVVRPESIETMLHKYVNKDGSISSLSLEFGPTYIPLLHQSEIRLVAAMLAETHNQHINAMPEVRVI